MSAIADALKGQKPVYLVEIHAPGKTLRYATRSVVVDGRPYEPLLSSFSVGSSFSLPDFTYSRPSLSLTVSNVGRKVSSLGDIDGSSGLVYLWAPGLTKAQIEHDGLLFSGIFLKKHHTVDQYSFQLYSRLSSINFMSLPLRFINLDSWPDARQSGGAGSVIGQAENMVFGEIKKGVPCPCVDTVMSG